MSSSREQTIVDSFIKKYLEELRPIIENFVLCKKHNEILPYFSKLFDNINPCLANENITSINTISAIYVTLFKEGLNGHINKLSAPIFHYLLSLHRDIPKFSKQFDFKTNELKHIKPQDLLDYLELLHQIIICLLQFAPLLDNDTFEEKQTDASDNEQRLSKHLIERFRTKSFIANYWDIIDKSLRNIPTPSKNNISGFLTAMTHLVQAISCLCHKEQINSADMIANIYKYIFARYPLASKLGKKELIFLVNLQNSLCDITTDDTFKNDPKFQNACHEDMITNCCALLIPITGLISALQVRTKEEDIKPASYADAILKYLSDKYIEKVGYLFTQQIMDALPKETFETISQLITHHDQLVDSKNKPRRLSFFTGDNFSKIQEQEKELYSTRKAIIAFLESVCIPQTLSQDNIEKLMLPIAFLKQRDDDFSTQKSDFSADSNPLSPSLLSPSPM
ncbi:MAG TPA: hypothetical protein VHA13_00195 [Gammaproteobacteria bacterium]|nr:hypothetical protein [Gammaproteobacteria bacterium]